MAYYQPPGIRQFVPTYTHHSDYLPTVVREGNSTVTADLLRRYHEEKQRGRVFTTRPAEFNPSRIVSYCVHQNVGVDRPLDHDHFSRIYRR